jgi:gamma-glutamylcyclotransferase (GGCT)/AIG2-like uncharacterized protein YtfP
MRAPTCSLYFAYGSNLSIRQMARRCPAATPLHDFKLEDSKLVFRGVADCPRVEGSVCFGGLYRITAECEDALDRYEGVHGGFYRKDYIPLSGDFGDSHLMFYVMNSTGVFPPSRTYLETVAQGYRDFRLPMESLKEAVAYAHDHRSPSHEELRRYARRGHPLLAERPLLPGEKELPKRKPVVGLPEPDRLPLIDDDEWHRKFRGRNMDEYLAERRRQRRIDRERARKLTEQRLGSAAAENFNLFDEWWHSPLTDND